MGIPWNQWQAGAMYGMPVPLIPPPSTVVDPESAVRDCAERATNGDRTQYCSADLKRWLGEWAKVEEHRNVIMEVIKARLRLEWPYNIKGLDILSVMPSSVLPGLTEELTKLSTLPASTFGHAELKAAATPLLAKAKEEQGKLDDEEAKKKQEAIAAMWGQLWANSPRGPPADPVIHERYFSWPYLYGMIPHGSALPPAPPRDPKPPWWAS